LTLLNFSLITLTIVIRLETVNDRRLAYSSSKLRVTAMKKGGLRSFYMFLRQRFAMSFGRDYKYQRSESIHQGSSSLEQKKIDLQEVSEKYLKGEATSGELRKVEENSGINYRAITYGTASATKEIYEYFKRLLGRKKD